MTKLITQEQLNVIKTKIKKNPSSEDKEWLISKPYWSKHHTEINQYLQQHVPNTHVVAMPDGFKYYENFIQKSDFYYPTNVKFIKMKQSNCHDNCEELLQENKIKFCVFGYALSEDGLFRVHSWGLDNYETIIETTEPRLLYFGYIL